VTDLNQIDLFLDWWEKHGRYPDELRVDGWVMRTPGCSGDYGCCSKSFDLSDLADALYELTGRKEPPLESPSRAEVKARRKAQLEAILETLSEEDRLRLLDEGIWPEGAEKPEWMP
jgi:hypothetical protein